MDSAIINYESRTIPTSFSLLTLRHLPPIQADRLRLIFVSRGNPEFIIAGRTYSPGIRSAALIPPNTIHSIMVNDSEDASVLVFELDSDMICSGIPGLIPPAFRPLILHPDKQPYTREIYGTFANLIRCTQQGSERTRQLELVLYSTILLTILADNCAFNQNRASQGSSDQMIKAMDFILAHYREPLRIQDAAEIAAFSPAYFSRCFSAYAGVPFSKYLVSLRLLEGRRLLRRGETVANAAAKSGFSDIRAFVRAYRKYYGTTPKHDRPGAKAANEELPSPPSEETKLLITECLEQLINADQIPVRSKQTNIPDVSMSIPGSPFVHTWQRTIGGGQAQKLLLTSNQNALKELQEQIGFERISIHGIFDDDMQILQKKPDRTLRYSFGYIDMLLDFLVTLSLKPEIQLGYMPSILAKDTSRLVYGARGIASLPKNLHLWTALVENFMLHLFERYGKAEVETWTFCMWSKPDSFPLPLGVQDVDEYFAFYKHTFLTIKSCSPNIRFASPGFIPESIDRSDWIKRFLELCIEEQCLPDSIRFDVYPMVQPADLKGDFWEQMNLFHQSNPDSMLEAVNRITGFCRTNHLPYEKVELEEWNYTILQQELLNDTAYKAVFIVKNILDCWDKVDAMTYWSFHDASGDVPLSNRTFSGGLGLFAKNGLKKASYYAFELLAGLGSRVFCQGDGYIITTSEDGCIQMLLYNYCHYSSLYANDDSLNLSFTNRYASFLDQKRNLFSIGLRDLAASEYLCTRTRLNRQYGSSFDNWINMGSMELTSMDDVQYLREISQPQRQSERLTPQDGRLGFTIELEPFEVCLIELKLMKT